MSLAPCCVGLLLSTFLVACCTFGVSGMNTLIGSATADTIATAGSSSSSADSGSASASSSKKELKSNPSSVQIL